MVYKVTFSKNSEIFLALSRAKKNNMVKQVESHPSIMSYETSLKSSSIQRDIESRGISAMLSPLRPWKT